MPSTDIPHPITALRLVSCASGFNGCGYTFASIPIYAMRAQFEVLIFRVTSVRYCLISQNGQVVENWRSASRTEIRITYLAAMEITVDHQDDNHEVQRPTDWPVEVRNKIDLLKKSKYQCAYEEEKKFYG
ncbi:hypothetical protein AVEN_139244-1 [Araneus ventricosus]|uniref:Uncharacterized protein n=1 Tax=Araneus ventricosus TaxID=182803 RepID=A0A4Y2PVR8_ARAVE|nr:hypothetical protein AVEN_139244-1 [Araneus ventricosus]